MRSFALTLAAIILSLVYQPAKAQQPIEVKEIKKAMSQGTQHGLMVHVHQALPKDVEKAWEKLMKSNAVNKAKLETLDDEMFIPEVVLERVSKDPIGIYARLLETTTGVEVYAYFKNANGFFSPENEAEKYDLAKLIMHDFAVKGYKQAVENELAAEDKKLKQMMKELDKLLDQQKSLEGKVVDNNRAIEKANTEILTAESDQSRLMEQIDKEKDRVHNLRDSPDAQKEAEKDLKDLEKDLKKNHNDIDKLHKDIHNAEADIRQLEHEIDVNKQEQDHTQNDIEQQKDLIKKVEEKLKGIK